MKRKIAFVCLVALLSGSVLPIASVTNTASIKQIALGDKKVHHPVHINSMSEKMTQVL